MNVKTISFYSKNIFLNALPGLLAAAMVGTAAALGEKEIIFPEAAAIATGLFAAPKKSWQTSGGRIVFSIAVCAVAGWAVSAFLPLALWLKMSAALVIGQLVLLFSKTSFAPMLSAAVLPVMLGTKSPVYPAAATLITAAAVLIRLWLEKAHLKEAEPFTPLPKPGKNGYIDLTIRCCASIAGIALAAGTGFTYAAAPPMLVAFTEWTSPQSHARQTPVKAVLLLNLCTLSGVLCRWSLTICLGCNPALAACAAGWITAAWMAGFKMYMPPAAALPILAMLIPETALALYPVQILAGSTVFMAAAVWIAFIKRKANKPA